LKRVDLIIYSSFALLFFVFSLLLPFLFSLIFLLYTGISAIRVVMEERKKDLVLTLRL
jgi:hypothetical protein